MNGIKIVGIIIIVFLFQEIKAQTCCSGGTPLTGNLGIQSIEPNSWYFQLSYDYNFLDKLYNGSQLLNDKSRERTTQSTLLQAIYPISERFSVNGLFSFVNQKRTIFSPLGTINKTTASGIGDVVLMIQYRVYSNLKRSGVLAIGPKLPLGKFDAVDPEFGLALATDLQPGTGSLDGIMGGSFSEYHFLKQNLTLTAVASYRLTTNAKRFEGDNAYKFGNEFMLSLGLTNRFQLKKISFDPFVFFRYRNSAPDQISGFDLPGTGGNWAYIIPGFNFEPNNKWSFNISGEIPFFQNLKGTQLTTSYRLTAGIAFKLFKK
jgi:hypothetical protein